jgi:trimethylamine--corrinoid protein Co-methyltransferase
VLVALLCKTNLNHDVGYLEAGLAFSPEYLVLADEIIAQSRQFTQGVDISPESLAVSVVNDVGPGGEFMSHEHTLANWRSLWVPQLFDRQRLDPWQEKGAKDLNARVREKTVAIMNEHKVEPLPASVDAKIDRILEKATT